jgi:microcin C transport system substrate-binding protein
MGAAPAAAVQPVHAVAMHGAPKYDPDFPHFEYVNPDAPKGGEVRLADLGGFDSLNGFIVKGEKAAGLGLIYDTLLTTSADEPFTAYGLLAESVELPEDRSWVAFTLRQGARWHDGKPVTVEDVIFSFQVMREKGAPSFRFYYGNVAKVEATGERTVTFTFKPGQNRELPLILGQFAILPKHYWEGREFAATTLEPPLGSGPYRITEVDPGRSITYQRVPEYWGRALPVNVGQYNFGRIRYDYYRDGTVALEAFKAAAYDFRPENSSKDWATSYDVPAVADGLLRREELPHQRPSGMQGFVYNIRRGIFQDPRTRQALAYAFDFEWSNKNLFYGQYTRTRSYFDNSELASSGLPRGRELALLEPYRGRVPDEVFTTPYEPPVTDGAGRVRGNLREADRLLKEAGWTIGGGRRVDAGGRPLSFEILLVSPLFERIALPFAKNLERLGIEARVRVVDSAQYQRRLNTFDFDMVVGVWGQSLSPGNEQRNYWGSAAAAEEGSRNWAGVRDPVVDELIETLVAAADREELVTAARALDRVLLWGHYLIPHWHLDYDRLAYWDKFGRPEMTPLQGYQFYAWWVDPQREAALAARKGSTERR